MKKRQLKGRAQMPDPNRSLFKFKLVWAFDAKGIQPKPQTWYSFDYSGERGLFAEGLDKELRFIWKELLSLCWKNQPLYEGIKWLRPHRCGPLLELYLPAGPAAAGQIAQLERSQGWRELEGHVSQLGFEDFAFRTVCQTHPRQPGNSPGRVNFREFYGFKYLHRNDFIVSSLSQGRLLKVDVYDNIMYHNENHLHTLFGRIQGSESPRLAQTPSTLFG